jgi:isoamylase
LAGGNGMAFYRDQVRDFWRGGETKMTEFAQRFTGSPDLYHNSYRRPTASINFITAHDGFTLNDLVSYNDKHNEANGDDNKDGDDSNHSWNCGVEGPTDQEDIVTLRAKQKRNFLTTLLLSQGVPMITAGDEWGRTQNGNNNGYCQDNEISWLNWGQADQQLLEFTKAIIHFCKEHPSFQRRRWFQDMPVNGSDVKDIMWFSPDGNQIPEENWGEAVAGSFGVFLSGLGIRCVSLDGKKLVDDNFYILFNPADQKVDFKIPSQECGDNWNICVDTGASFVGDKEGEFHPEQAVPVADRSIIILKCRAEK